MSRLPVLMYHKVSSAPGKGLTIQADRLEEQFSYLKDAGYTSIHGSDLNVLATNKAHRLVHITFDDGYVNQLELAYPLLQKYGLKATLFIPLKFVGQSDQWNEKPEPLMNWEQLTSLNPEVVELAYHSYGHQWYTDLDPTQWEEDMHRALQTAEESGLVFHKIIAYPYGKYPRKDPEKAQFFQHLRAHNFQWGYRIGNRINQLPVQRPYEMERIDVKGEFSLATFRRKLRWGKWGW